MGQMNDARDRIEDILNEKEYRIYYDESRNLFEEWWNQLKKWLADLLENLFPSIGSANGAAELVLLLIIFGALLLLGIAVFYLVRNTRSKKLSKQKPLHSDKELSWTYQKHLREAKKQEENQDFTAATRHLFLALLLYFHEKEWLEARAWKTNWEYYDELRKVNQSWAHEFYDLALVFDEVTYGEYEIDKLEYLQFRDKAFTWLSDIKGGVVNEHAQT